MIAIIQPDETGVGNSSGHPLKLKTRNKCKYDDEATKQRKRFKAVQDNIFGGLIDEVNKEYNDEIYKVTEHSFDYLFIG